MSQHMELDREMEINSSHENEGKRPNKRTYECVFCKRGFTNAQALGGHMNIHRRDRAKTKHNTTGTNSMVEKNYFPNPGFGRISRVCPVSWERSNLGHKVFVPTGSNPRTAQLFRLSGLDDDDLEILGSDLSLRTGYDGKNIGDEPDLELRLGHYP